MENATKFFGVPSASSDDDNTDSSSVSSGDSSESEVSAYWLQFTDDEDGGGQSGMFGGEKKGMMSKQEKSADAIEKLASEVDFAADDASYTVAMTGFEKLMKLVRAHVDRYHELLPAFTELLEQLPDSEQDLEGKTKADFADDRDYSSLRKLVGLVQEATKYAEETAAQIAAAEAAEENEDDDEGKELTAEDYAAKLVNFSQQRKNKPTAIYRVATKCRANRFVGLEITALAMHVSAVIDEDSSFNYTTLPKWNTAFRSAAQCVERILANPQVTISENISAVRSDRAAIVGDLKDLLALLYTHIVRAAQWIPVDSKEYLPLPSCENKLAALADSVLTYYLAQKSRRADRNAVAIAAMLMDILGYRPPAAHKIMYEALQDEWTFVTSSVSETVDKLMDTLMSLDCEEEIVVRGVCYVAYQRGLAGQYRQGRDLLLRSGVGEFVSDAVGERNYELAVLLNRTIGQLALAAFIAGDIQQAYQLIGTLWSCRDPDSQLGQKMGGRYKERDEVILALRDLLVPAHLRIPYEHLEVVAMLSALAVDTLAEAQNPYERTKLMSYFYRTVTNRRQQLVGKPSSVAEQVAAAYRHLKTGDYQSTKEVVESMSAWETFPNGEKVRAQYLECLKERGLQIFCYVNRCNFSTFSVEQLALKYDLSESRAHDAMTQCIADGSNTLTAFWDRDDKFLVVDRNNMSRLQHVVYSTATAMNNLDPFTERRVRAADARGRGRGRGRGGYRGGRGQGDRPAAR